MNEGRAERVPTSGLKTPSRAFPSAFICVYLRLLCFRNWAAAMGVAAAGLVWLSLRRGTKGGLASRICTEPCRGHSAGCDYYIMTNIKMVSPAGLAPARPGVKGRLRDSLHSGTWKCGTRNGECGIGATGQTTD